VEICHLTQGMGAGISPSAAGNLHSLTQNSGKGLFDFSLNGILLPRQTLPSPITGTVIADIKPQIPHTPPILPLLPVHYLRKTGNYLYDRKPGYVPAHFE
jgi:hypothetical protein